MAQSHHHLLPERHKGSTCGTTEHLTSRVAYQPTVRKRNSVRLLANCTNTLFSLNTSVRFAKVSVE